MSDTERFVDIHCHILPQLDDGADSWDESLAMARLAVNDEISTIVCTPHQLGNYNSNDGRTIRDQVAMLQRLLEAKGVPLAVLPGGDVRIEPDMIRKIRDGDVLTLADGGRYVLLELPHEVYFHLDRLLEELDAAELVGILSHPERNRGILRQPRVVERLVRAGCLLQLTADSLTGAFGSEIKVFSEWLVSEGLVHFVATDAHGFRSRRPLLGSAFDRVVDLADYATAEAVCCRNPARVVDGRDVARGRRRHARRLAQWFRRRKAS